MTKTTSASLRSISMARHSSSVNGAPKLYESTRRSRPCCRLISRSACLSGASRLEPTLKTATLTLLYSFELVSETSDEVSHPFQNLLIRIPVAAVMRLEQALCQRPD